MTVHTCANSKMPQHNIVNKDTLIPAGGVDVTGTGKTQLSINAIFNASTGTGR